MYVHVYNVMYSVYCARDACMVYNVCIMYTYVYVYTYMYMCTYTLLCAPDALFLAAIGHPDIA